MSNERLDAIEARLGETTSLGEWETTRANDIVIYSPNGFGAYRIIAHASDKADAEFIANAPTDIRDLIALARKQADALDAVERLAVNVEALFAEMPEPHGASTRAYATAIRDFRATIRAALESKP